MKIQLKKRIVVLVCGLITFFTALSVFPQNTVWEKTNSALLKMSKDEPKKTPLILIHGINGTQPCHTKGSINSYWENFRLLYGRDTELQSKYSLFVFQYCSNLVGVSVSEIALELRDLIDEYLTDRNYVILAHSMGGLVAKSYMVEAKHLRGEWKHQFGGDTTIGIITLATLHHGTPGANLPETLKDHFAIGWRAIYEKANGIYWRGSLGESHPAVTDSSLPNRSDLRWDNYNFKLDVFSNDINEKLFNRNLVFQKYSPKLIAYSGFLENSTLNIAAKVTEEISKYENLTVEVSEKEKFHRRLFLANAALYYGLSKIFGTTDGLVPFKSGLFCDSEVAISPINSQISAGKKNFICQSPSRVRRFEPGEGAEIPKSELPDTKTLSILRARKGFDHLDMLESADVLIYVAEDLKGFLVKPGPIIPPEINFPKVPTLFLFDVSGSMNENGKINQARDAGLDALREMREAGGGNASPVSIMTFSGDSCGGNVTKNLLGFTGNLTQADGVMRGLPSPNGGTPLPQAKDAAWAEMQRFLAENPSVNDGRIVLLSDGQSTCGAIRPPGVFSRSETVVSRSDSRIKFFTVGFDVPPGSAAERDLQYLASATGGKYFHAADRRQLIRALQKQVRRYLPFQCRAASTDLNNGTRAFAASDYRLALESFQKYAQANPNDSCGSYNLALAFEANDRYKTAADIYRRYLASAPNAAERAKIERRIAQLRQDYADQFDYLINLIQSDLDYLKRFYDSIYNRSSGDLAREFIGFVSEKRDFYAALAEVFEADESWLKYRAKDISSALDTLARRYRMPNFDQDAISLLTVPIDEIEQLLPELQNYRANNIR